MSIIVKESGTLFSALHSLVENVIGEALLAAPTWRDIELYFVIAVSLWESELISGERALFRMSALCVCAATYFYIHLNF